MADPTIPTVDYLGAQGGMMAMAFAAGATFAATLLSATAALMWRMFGDARIKQLEADLGVERKRCDEQMAVMQARIAQLETMLLLHGTPTLRAQMQNVISEQRLETDALKEGPTS